MQEKLLRIFSCSSGALVLALVSVLFVSNLAGAGQVSARDPVFGMTVSALFWMVGAAGLIVALVCLFGRSIVLKVTLVLWLAMNLSVYQWAVKASGIESGLRGYLGPLADAFGMSIGTAEVLLKVLVLCLLAGSLAGLVWLSARRLFAVKPGGKLDYLKAACPHCSGRIEFPATGLGQQISCPHCAATMTLHAPPRNRVQSIKA